MSIVILTARFISVGCQLEYLRAGNAHSAGGDNGVDVLVAHPALDRRPRAAEKLDQLLDPEELPSWIGCIQAVT